MGETDHSVVDATKSRGSAIKAMEIRFDYIDPVDLVIAVFGPTKSQNTVIHIFVIDVSDGRR